MILRALQFIVIKFYALLETTCIITNTAKLLVFDKYKIIHTARKIKKDFHMLFINIYELSVFQKY